MPGIALSRGVPVNGHSRLGWTAAFILGVQDDGEIPCKWTFQL